MKKFVQLDQTNSRAATYNPSVRPLREVIAAFQKTHPDIKFKFLISYRRTLEKWLCDGEVDIAVVQSPSEEFMGNHYSKEFAVDTLEFFTYAGHPLTKGSSLDDQAFLLVY